MNKEKVANRVREVAELLNELKCQFHGEQDGGEMDITIAYDNKDNLQFQTGDNSYSGACYQCKHWGVGTLCEWMTSDDIHDLATQLVDEIEELNNLFY